MKQKENPSIIVNGIEIVLISNSRSGKKFLVDDMIEIDTDRLLNVTNVDYRSEYAAAYYRDNKEFIDRYIKDFITIRKLQA